MTRAATRMSTLRRAGCGAVCAVSLAAAGTGGAQAPASNHAADPGVPGVSRSAADVARIDETLRMRGLVVDDPRGHWVAGHFDATDPADQVRHYADARVAAPSEALYQASLAVACQQPVQPTLPECDSVDRLADWATRDADNGTPMLLLAAKAARRGNGEFAIAYLEQAAARPRFDDYSSRGWLVFWDYVMALQVQAEPAAKAEAAIGYAAEQPRAALSGFAGMCGGAAEAATARRAACARAGVALAERGATFAARETGAVVAERNAENPAAAERARASRTALDAERARCAADEQQWRVDGQSADAAARARGVAAWDRNVHARAAMGEVAACRQRAKG